MNPARRLRLYGAVEGADAPVYVWTAQLHSNNTDTLEQSITLATATGLNSANLVVSPNQLLPNHRYLFTLAATTQFSDGVSTIEISINGPPIGGALSVIPTEGKAITDRFQLTAAAWTDDDLPCTYRFGTISQLQQSAYMYLTEYSVSPTTSTLLPAGRAADNNTVTVFVEVRDDLGSTALSAHNVTVMWFVPPENVSMSSFASSLLIDGPSGVLDVAAAGQLIGSLAAVLNGDDESGDGNETTSAEAMATREVLVNAMIASVTTNDSAQVTRASQLMSTITAKPEQMTADATTNALRFALSLSSTAVDLGDKAEVEETALESLADITSNLVLASAKTVFASSSGGIDRAGSEREPVNQTDADEILAANVVQTALLSKIVDNIGTSLANTMVPAEPERFLSTASFDLMAQVNDAKQFAGSTIGDGKISVPNLPIDGLAIARVISWIDAGPLAWARHQPDSNTTFRSPLLSVSFARSDGSEIVLSGLSQPFEVVLDTLKSEGPPGQSSAGSSFGCAHWNVGLSKWITDGMLVAQTESNITCQVNHLTDFAALFGPDLGANEFATVDELFSLKAWADNLLGLCVVLSLLAVTTVLVVYSLCVHLRGLQAHGNVVDGEIAAATDYARRLLTAGYQMTKTRFCQLVCTKLCFKLRAETVCGALWCQLDGDPFSRAQRLLLVFLTMLSALFFNVLFFKPEMEPICVGDALSGLTCRTFVCPSCYSLYGDSNCDSAQQVAPLDLCVYYVPSRHFSAHDACELRPFEACRVESHNSLQFVDPVHGLCAKGQYAQIPANHTRNGKLVSTACFDDRNDLRKTIMKALLTAACTIPVIVLLKMLFDTFRKPTVRALEGEARRQWKSYLPVCCSKQQIEVRAVGPHVEAIDLTEDTERLHIIYKTPTQLAAEEPDRLQHKSPGR